MILGLGLDLVELQRIETIWRKYQDKFVQKILGSKEIIAFNKRPSVEFLASRFAAKEATVKALGTGFSKGIYFSQIEVINTDLGKPKLLLSDKAEAYFKHLGGKNLYISLTHSQLVAGAVVIIEG